MELRYYEGDDFHAGNHEEQFNTTAMKNSEVQKIIHNSCFYNHSTSFFIYTNAQEWL